MTTIPTDLLARLRAVLTAAEAMTPGPLRVVEGSNRHVLHRVIGVTGDGLSTFIVTDANHRAMPEADAAGFVALKNATTDLAALLALVEAPAPSPAWTVEPYVDGLTRHTITRGRVRLVVLAGYDDGMAHGEIAIVYGPGREDVVRKSWFGGANRTAEESLADAKAGTLAMAREIGAVALVEAPAPHVDRDDLALAMVAAGDNSGHADAIRSGRTPLPGWALAAASVAIARLTGRAPAPLTVGAALADPRVQDGSHVVEYSLGDEWLRLGKSGVRRWCLGARWLPTSDRMWLDVYALPCRLVPLAVADRDPSTRGPL